MRAGGSAVRFAQGWPHQTIDFCSGSYLCSIKYLTLWKPTLMVYRANVTVVQRVVFPAGATMLVHCHTLQHADYGLMGYLRVGAGAAPCAAGARASDGSCAVGALLVAAAVVLVAYASVRNYVVAVSKEPRLLAEYRLGPLQ